MSDQLPPKQGQTFIEKKSQKDLRHLAGKLKTKKSIAVICLLFLVLATVGFFYAINDEEVPLNNDSQEYARAFLDSDDSEETNKLLVKEYGSQFDESFESIKNSDASVWDKEMLDKASAALLYADKMKAYSQAAIILAMINSAEIAGLDVNDNSYGVNQDIRDAIKQRADDFFQQSKTEAGIDLNE